ncbi:MAG: VOC family protein [Acidimicrobiales bacterium]
MRLRQLVLAVAELDPVVEELCGFLGVEICYRDSGVANFGLHNALMVVGDQFLEVVSPIREGTTAGRFLERKGGDAGYMVIFQVPDLAAARRRVDAASMRVVWEGSVPGIRGMHLHPADIGGAIVSLDQADPADGWPWAGPEWREHARPETVSGFAAAHIHAGSPSAMAARWGAVLGIDPVVDASGSCAIGLDDAVVRFHRPEDDRGEGLVGIDLTASDRSRAGDSALIGGVTFRLL